MDPVVYDAVIKAIPFLLIAIAILVGVLRHRDARHYQARGVHWLLALRVLITHLQRHRGLSMGVLGGARELIPELEAIRARVGHDIAHIDAVGDWMDQREDWQSIVQHWARLSGNIMRLSAQRSLEQHTRLIQNTLYLVDEVANAHYLNELPGRTESIWRELLTLAEYVGQIRATGMAMAALGDTNPNAEVNMRQRLDTLIKDVYQILEIPHYAVGLNEQLLQEIIDFLRFVDQKLLRQGVDITASELYEMATRKLDIIYARFDEELSIIRQRLKLS